MMQIKLYLLRKTNLSGLMRLFHFYYLSWKESTMRRNEKMDLQRKLPILIKKNKEIKGETKSYKS